MAELNVDDVRAFTGERLADADDDTLQALLDAALSAARRYCGWPVCPVIEGAELVVDGPGGRVLSLPTLNLLEVTELAEAGVAVDVAKLDVSRRKGTVEKYPYGCWTARSGGIAVTMTHGFTEAEAADWRRGVLRLVDLMSLEPVTVGAERDTPDLIFKRVDDVQYQWSQGIISNDQRLSALFSSYRILPSP